jgi:L1 cell adhesion molecule like protein
MGEIGIDFGTTFSKVARFTRHGPEMIPMDGDMLGIPSEVAFSEGEWPVGLVAAELSCDSPTTVFRDLKVMFGCNFDTPAIQRAIQSKTWAFELVRADDGGILIPVQEKTRTVYHRPYELAGKIIARLKEAAEDVIGHPVTQAVLTVPAYFNDAQRTDAKLAATSAGFETVRLLSEPSAGAIVYGYGLSRGTTKTVLVFDCGGGTTDVSIMDIVSSPGKASARGRSLTEFVVKAVSGDPHLGGRDFDERLVDICLKSFDPSGTTTRASLDPEVLVALRTDCTKAKRALCNNRRAPMFIRRFVGGKPLKVVIARKQFEDGCVDLLGRMLLPGEEALEQCGKTVNDIGDVILIGGSSAIPRVREVLSALFNGRPVFSGTAPIEAVARGAAIVAGKMTSHWQFPEIDDIELIDIGPLALGVRIVGQTILLISVHGETAMELIVFQGPWMITPRNTELATFEIRNIPPAEAEVECGEVTFKLDRDGILDASARIISSGEEPRLDVTKRIQLFNREKVRKSLEQRRRAKKAILDEYNETGRKVKIDYLDRNMRTFAEEEPTKNRRFAAFVSAAQRSELLSIIARLLPASLHRVPSWVRFSRGHSSFRIY